MLEILIAIGCKRNHIKSNQLQVIDVFPVPSNARLSANSIGIQLQGHSNTPILAFRHYYYYQRSEDLFPQKDPLNRILRFAHFLAAGRTVSFRFPAIGVMNFRYPVDSTEFQEVLYINCLFEDWVIFILLLFIFYY